MGTTHLLLLAQLLACWPAWLWLGRRYGDGDGEVASAFALAAAIALWWQEHRRQRNARQDSTPVIRFRAATLLLLAYAAACVSTAPAVRALLALYACAAALQATTMVVMPLGWWAMWGLGLPSFASLQFYLGYPLRLLAAEGSAGLLRITGLAVRREGVELLLGVQRVGVDAPCSGIRMLWTAAFLAAMLAGAFRLGWWRTMAGFAGALVLVVLANVFRSAALFFIEAGLVEAPAWAHAATGMAVFALAAVAIVILMSRLQRVTRCVTR